MAKTRSRIPRTLARAPRLKTYYGVRRLLYNGPAVAEETTKPIPDKKTALRVARAMAMAHVHRTGYALVQITRNGWIHATYVAELRHKGDEARMKFTFKQV